jgi:hypothetical protein
MHYIDLHLYAAVHGIGPTAFSLTNECCLFRVVPSTRLKIMRRTTLSSYEGNIGIQASLRGGLRRNAFDKGRSPL